MVIKLDMQHVILPINMWKRPFHFLFMTNTPCHSMFQLLSILLPPIISMIHINLAMSILIISKAHMRELPMLLGMTLMQQTCNMSVMDHSKHSDCGTYNSRNKLISHQRFGPEVNQPQQEVTYTVRAAGSSTHGAGSVGSVCMHTSHTRVPVIVISSFESMIIEANSTSRLF